ncbi:hypothetical protein KOM00_11985 [Geomonas sp. Red69]|uniref:Uncharacterized protein n=1 Tax=Geomonas diazotrophica TaxID=2843197 RepID=A0ABX8JHM1_9BACT|nr:MULTISPECIES: hypothetical protein [Geomonas]MBU5637450.1 hypothetical protein [Geomonas diazotrophica]QWV97883.1 hypothetical protein KP005_00880 [Geomonas nitrogeniifigens]QXE87023.1 hypothetical protein KP003_01025 [Geomonas nitrogeniifigens]
MKRIALIVMAGFLAMGSVPTFAADMGAKDECLLISKNCKNEVDSIQQKIAKLQGEINKGSRVYTADELKKLHDKLKEANDVLDELNKPGH